MDVDDAVVEYEALSWCWGQEVKDRAIRVYEGGKYYRLPVTRDLTLALKYLRHPHAERILWIDALCINQANHEERNHQVQMMARIYSGAKQACIWLGEDTDDSTTAIRFINEIMKLENFDAISEKKENSFKWQSLLLLMQRPWFSRRWVVQEIALARSATIYCGNDKIPWTNFAVAVELFVEVETATHRLSEVMRKDETFGHVPQWFEHVSELGASVLVQATGKVFRRDGNQATDSEDGVDAKPRLRARRPARKGLKRNETGEVEGPSQRSALAPQRPLLSLEYLVSSLSVFQATQPRDAVYSLLAISRDTAPFAELRIKSQEGSEEAIIMSTVSSFLERKPFRVDYTLLKTQRSISIQAVIWNRCLIKTDEPLSVLGLASQHVQKDDLICIIFGCTVPVILRIKYKAEGAPGKEKMQDQIESMKAAMEVCEEACFRKIRYQKRLQIEKAKGGGLDTIWKKEVLAELEEVNSQMRKWKEREEEDKERKIAEDKDQENRKERIKRRQREARMTRDEAKLQPLQKSKTMPDAGLRSMVTKTGPSPVKEGMPEQSEGAQSTHATPPQTHGQDGHDGVRETGQTTTEQLEKERQKKKDEAREEDPKVYYEFLGEAYIHGMMDGEAVRRQINEGEPTRMFEIR
ncbi:hypothetical protein FJTKL_06792 [Diaporthe vaccinii]|uniref:Heterokaryon incompatibility domain-containing protein n=1 Tax=Diaporthe vaccinii TaxID=105482 RepID=A0ABR4DPR8_9PEZI